MYELSIFCISALAPALARHCVSFIITSGCIRRVGLVRDVGGVLGFVRVELVLRRTLTLV